MERLVLLLVFFGTLLLILGTYGFINRRRLAAAAALRERLAERAEVERINILRDERRSSVAMLDRALRQWSITPAIQNALERGGVKWTVGEFVLASAVTGALGLLGGQEVAGDLIGVLGGLFGVVLPYGVLRQLQARRQRKFEEQLPEAIDMIVNAMRAGFSFQAAMKFVGEEIPAPLGEEFARFYDEQRLGLEVRTALLDMQERVGTLDAKMFVTSLLIQRETGGNLSEILGGLASLIRQRHGLRGKIDTLTAEPKFTGRVLALLPVIAFFALFALNRPMMMPLLETTNGRLVLAYAIVSVAVGYYILTRIADVDI